MGHRVSTPRHHHHDSYQGSTSTHTVATSLAILLAVASATTASSTVSSVSASCCGCFVSQSQQQQHQQQPRNPPWLVPPAASATSSSSNNPTSPPLLLLLRATSTAITTVPPPNSRLGRLMMQQSQPPGTKRSQRSGSSKRDKANNGSGRRTDLRYATYGSHYTQSCSDDDIHSSSDSDNDGGEGFSPLWRNSAAMEDADEDALAIAEATAKKEGNHTTTHDDDDDDDDMHESINNSVVVARSDMRRKRARMLRFLDKRVARLQFHSQQQQQQGPSLHNNNNNSAKNNNNSDSSDNSSSSSNSSNNRRLDYEQRKAAWAAKYTSVSTLRKSFGQNKNRIWGDFDPSSTRRLYHTLLPRALLELRVLRDGLLGGNNNNDDDGGVVVLEEDDNGEKKKKSKQQRYRRGLIRRPSSKDVDFDTIINDNDSYEEYLQQELKELAPLAYQARLAAKKYARERSRLPGRIGSMLYDGYRSWRQYGKWESSGMTWEQVWNKYEDQVLREAMDELEDGAVEEANALLESGGSDSGGVMSREELDDEELTARICLRILERSVVTNDAIDRLFLKRLAQDEDTTEERESKSAQEMVLEESRKNRRRQLRRKLAIQADLQAIEMKFDDDIRELLRYSNLTTREGEERRRKRKRDYFWNKKSGSDSEATIKVEQQQHSLFDNDQVVVGEGNNGLEQTIEAAAAFARGGGTTDSSATSSTSSTVNTAEVIPSKSDLASELFSMTEVSARLKLDENDSDDDDDVAASVNTNKDDRQLRKLAVHEVFALRILATTKQRISSLQALSQLGGGGSDNAETTASSGTEGDNTTK